MDDTVKKMTRAEKIALAEKLAEKKRRDRAASKHYTPNSAQLTIHQSTAKERFVFSGNSMGKSCALVHEIKFDCVDGYNPYSGIRTKTPNHNILLLDSPTKVDMIFLNEWKKWYGDDLVDKYEKLGKPHISRITFKNGSTLTFMFHDQAPMIFEGITFNNFYADEPFPKDIYIALYRGMRDKTRVSRVLMIGTPIAEPWFLKDIYGPWERGELPKVECFRFHSEVNRENLPEDYLEDYGSKMSDAERAVRLEGNFFTIGGAALAHLFKRETHVVTPFDWHTAWPVVVAIDPHPSKNHIAIMLGSNNKGQLYLIKEMSSKAHPVGFAEEFRDWCRGYNVVDIICDSLGSTPSTGGDGNKSFIEVLREHRIAVRSTNFLEKNDENFVQQIQQVLAIPENMDNLGKKDPTLLIFDGNMGIITDIEHVQWQKYRGFDTYKNKLEISNRDYLACLKYALTTRIHLPGGHAKVKRPSKPSPWSQNAEKAKPHKESWYNSNNGPRKKRGFYRIKKR